MANSLQCTALQEFPLVEPGDDISQLIITCLIENNTQLVEGDILVIAQKIISKAENRYRYLNDIEPSAEAIRLGAEADKDPRLMACILEESTEVLRIRKGAIIVRHRNGYVHANAGIDQSNITSEPDNPRVLLLPENPDASARSILEALQQRFKVHTNVVINDSAGRPWRNGIMGFAIGSAGFEVVEDHIGNTDLFGNTLQVTQIAVADELAAAASLLMGQGDQGAPVVLIRGLKTQPSNRGSEGLIRGLSEDLFR